MAERRSLVEGFKGSEEVDKELVEDFVYNRKPKPVRTPQTHEGDIGAEPNESTKEGKEPAANHLGRAPLTIRFRSNIAAALKRASLERQLSGVTPSTLQDILEEAVQPWLRSNGYLN
jgi:hypothetical protein